MNKLIRFISALCIVCLLTVNFPASNAFFSSSNDNDNNILYGRKQLQQYSSFNAMTVAYDRIVKGVENRDSYVFLADLFLSKDELNLVVSLYKNDPHPHFWLDSGYSYSAFTDGTVHSFKPYYNELGLLSNSEFNAKTAEFDSAAAKIIAKADITDDMSEYEIELRLHDVLVKELSYEDTANAHNAYGAIVEKSAVCQGYTLAFNYLLRLCGIEAHYVSGYSRDIPHSWSLVNADGDYFYTDITWDDPIGSYNDALEVYHSYFNLSYNAMSKDHIFGSIAYGLPNCDSENGTYFAHNPERIMTESPDADLVASFFENGIAAIYVPEDITEDFLNWYTRNLLLIAEKAGYDVTKSLSYFYMYVGCEYHLIIEGTLLETEEPEDPVVSGDTDGDGKVTSIDSNLLKRIIAGEIQTTESSILGADMDKDGRLTSIDSNLLKRLIAGN